MQWANSPVAVPTDLPLAAYSVRTSLITTNHSDPSFRNCNGSSPEVSTFCIAARTRSLDYRPIAIISSSLKASRRRFSNGVSIGRDYVLSKVNFFPLGFLPARAHRGSFLALSPNVRDYKVLISQFYFHYAMLVLNSFGLQDALDRTPINIGHFFARCHCSAMSCATLARDYLGPKGYLRYSPDSHCVMISYAVLTLLKVCDHPCPFTSDHSQEHS